MEIKIQNEDGEELTGKELFLIIVSEILFYGFISFFLYLLFHI